MEDRRETYDAETNPNGRWRRFSEDDVKDREDLNFKWLDFTEEDDRSVADILDEMQDEADGISAAVAQLKELLMTQPRMTMRTSRAAVRAAHISRHAVHRA